MLKHLAFGAWFAYILFLFSYVKNGFKVEPKKIVNLPYALLFCMIWSIFPNILGILEISIVDRIATNFYVSNIFFLYGVLDRVGSTGATWGLGAILVLFSSLVIILAIELHRQERCIASLKCKSLGV